MVRVHTELSIQKNVDIIPAPAQIRHKISSILEDQVNKPTQHNPYKNAIKSLKNKINNKQLIITKADKSNTTVILPKSDYIEKILS